VGLDCPCASALWTDKCRNWPPHDRGPSCAGRPQVTATKRGPSAAQPVLPHRSPHPTAHEHHDRRAPSTSRRLPPASFHSADAIAIAASADVRALATPHARHNRPVATPVPRYLPLPRQGPETAHPWAGPTGLPGGSRKGVPCVSRGPPSSKAQAQSGKPPAGAAAACCSPGEQQLENNRSEQQVTGSLRCSLACRPCRARES
jgi:hypothetical protein